jgi:hypothetical protein
MNWQHEKEMREEKKTSTKLIAQNRTSSMWMAQKRSDIEVKGNKAFRYLSHYQKYDVTGCGNPTSK